MDVTLDEIDEALTHLSGSMSRDYCDREAMMLIVDRLLDQRNQLHDGD